MIEFLIQFLWKLFFSSSMRDSMDVLVREFGRV